MGQDCFRVVWSQHWKVGTMVAVTAFALEKYLEEARTVSAILNMYWTAGVLFNFPSLCFS